MSLARNIDFLKRLPKLTEISSGNLGATLGSTSTLAESQSFGANPGGLRMYYYLPEKLQPGAPLVVVLHGCTQSAAGYDNGSGWSKLADRYGFALLLPQQQMSNNPNRCFNWFNLEDVTRGQGEVASINDMISQMIADHGVDRRRVYVTGLSAGGAMTSAMLASYPETFAGGAIIAGLPFGAATNVQQALSAMRQPRPHTASELGNLVRHASRHDGPWPKVSVWHGSADHTVNPANASEIVKQWVDLHHLSATPTLEATVDGYPHQEWRDDDGKTVLESYVITGMSHGTPLGEVEGQGPYGSEGPFMLEAGISSSYHIASFFGLTQSGARPQATSSASQPRQATGQVSNPATYVAATSLADAHSAGVNINAVITRALKSAGLMK